MYIKRLKIKLDFIKKRGYQTLNINDKCLSVFEKTLIDSIPGNTLEKILVSLDINISLDISYEEELLLLEISSEYAKSIVERYSLYKEKGLSRDIFIIQYAKRISIVF